MPAEISTDRATDIVAENGPPAQTGSPGQRVTVKENESTVCSPKPPGTPTRLRTSYTPQPRAAGQSIPWTQQPNRRRFTIKPSRRNLYRQQLIARPIEVRFTQLDHDRHDRLAHGIRGADANAVQAGLTEHVNGGPPSARN